MKTPRELIAKHVDWVKDEWPMVHEDDALEALWEFGMACFKKGCMSFTHNEDGVVDEVTQEFFEETKKKNNKWHEEYLEGKHLTG